MTTRKQAILQEHVTPRARRTSAQIGPFSDLAKGAQLQWRATRALFDVLAASTATRIVAALMANVSAIYWLALAPHDPAIRWAFYRLAGGNLIVFYLQMLAAAHLVVPLVTGNTLALGALLARPREDAEEVGG